MIALARSAGREHGALIASHLEHALLASRASNPGVVQRVRRTGPTSRVDDATLSAFPAQVNGQSARFQWIVLSKEDESMLTRISERRSKAGVKENATQSAQRTEQPPGESEDIRRRANEIYQARIGSGQSGDALSDWLQAEREVRARTASESHDRLGGYSNEPRM